MSPKADIALAENIRNEVKYLQILSIRRACKSRKLIQSILEGGAITAFVSDAVSMEP